MVLGLHSKPLFAETPGELKVMTFNINRSNGLAEEQMKKIARFFRKNPSSLPDFILLQEVYFYDSNVPLKTSAAAVLAKELNYYFQGQKKGGLIGSTEGSAILSRYPFTHFGSQSMDSYPLLDSKRLAIMGEFDVPALGRVRVINVHLAYASYMGGKRKHQMKQTIRWLRKRQEDPNSRADITFFGGDFNATADSEEVSILFNEDRAGDMKFQNLNSKESSFGHKQDNNRRIDLIFVSSKKLSVRLLEEKLFWEKGSSSDDSSLRFSDHSPVFHGYQFY